MPRPGPPAIKQGFVYTLHLDQPCKHAAHYTGWSADLPAELERHTRGRGARLLRVQLAAGGTWRVASVEPGTRDRETRLKERGAARRCAICITARAVPAELAGGRRWAHLDPPARDRAATPELQPESGTPELNRDEPEAEL